ncbi:MAG: hemerythrin domain-containing protein [SAR202 cluster bacterium]|nr:hemerythrin domain-containing protein [SAR202 cluster bacterium]
MKATKRSNGNSKVSTLPQVLELIKKDHDEVKGLFEQFEEKKEDDTSKAKELVHKIMDEVTLHSQIEEKLIYPQLKQLDEELFYEAQEEHHVVKLFMEELKRGPDDASFIAKAVVMKENLEHHIEEEESEVFEALQKLPEDILSELGDTWQSQKKAMARS